MNEVADEVMCARMPEPFNAVGLWYQNFDQTSDDEVRQPFLLQHVRHPRQHLRVPER